MHKSFKVDIIDSQKLAMMPIIIQNNYFKPNKNELLKNMKVIFILKNNKIKKYKLFNDT